MTFSIDKLILPFFFNYRLGRLCTFTNHTMLSCIHYVLSAILQSLAFIGFLYKIYDLDLTTYHCDLGQLTLYWTQTWAKVELQCKAVTELSHTCTLLLLKKKPMATFLTALLLTNLASYRCLYPDLLLNGLELFNQS